MAKTNIKTYSTATFRDRFMQPGQKLDTLLKSDFGKFFIVKVEDMLRLIKLPVPPTRATNHTFIYLTAGEAVMTIGSETYKIFQNECLVVPAGQVFSFGNYDVNQGYLCSFHHDYASLLHITPNHLNKVVKQITGKSPSKWIEETPVLEAKVLLYQTDLSINEVAAEIGILDPSYFSRLFKKQESVTPVEFRKMIDKS